MRNGPHDVGGAPGFGPIDIRPDGAPFPEGWEGRCVGAIIATLAQGLYNVDQFRARQEELPAAAQHSIGYYRRWLYTLERNLTLAGVLDAGAIERRALELAGDAAPALATSLTAAFPPPPDAAPRLAALEATIDALIRDGGPLLRELPDPPRFAVGDRVRTRRIAVERLGEQHTRLPGYAQEKPGTIAIVHPPMILPDASVGGEERVDHLYAVHFDAAELWPDGTPGQRVSVDLFESYLVPEEE